MRRVDAEGDSRGVRGQQKADSRTRWKLRRAAIEWLERRELLSTSTSTLPSPTVISAPNVTPNAQVQDLSLATAAQALTGAPSGSSPSVAVDPLNPLRMVATWVDQDPNGYNPGGFSAPVTSYIEGAYSVNGGKTWTAMTAAAFGGINYYGETVNVQQDFSVTPSPGVFADFPETNDPTIGYDRSENFYILSTSHNAANTTGTLDLQRFSWPESGASPTYNGFTPVYTWDATDSGASADEVVTPVLAVDSNLPTFTDPATGKTVTDPYSGNIYAVWAEIDSNTAPGGIPGFNPDTIRMAASSNGGLDFTHAAYVDNSSNANRFVSSPVTNPPGSNILHDSSARYSEPSVSISQGNGTTVPGGQVTIVYDDYGTIAPLDQILDQVNQVGGTSDQVGFTFNPFGTSTVGVIPSGSANDVGIVPVPLQVSLPANFTLQALDTTLSVSFPNSSYIGAVLVPPTAAAAAIDAKTGESDIVLFNGDIGVEASGTPDSTANLGFTSGTMGGAGSGTVFDPEAVRSIRDGSVASHAVGHYKPDDESELEALDGLSGSVLSGTWTLELVVGTADTSTTDFDYINNVNLNFSQGNDPGYHPGNASGSQLIPESVIAGKNSLYEVPIPNINPTDTSSSYGVVYRTDNTGSPYYDGVAGTNVSGAGGTTAPTQAAAILPAPVIASDNTLGSFSSYQGRLYVAFTGKFTGSAAGDTDIFLAYSDDGGLTWSTLQQVNDDNAATDGFSGASNDAVGNDGITGRAQYEPQVAVDNSTGDVVVSFLDARNDPSNARVATYVAVSEDGATVTPAGNSGFAADVYANPSETAINAINAPGSNTVNLGPIPDNQSATGGVASTDGYGTRQALVVVNGRIVPVWASNENQAVKMSIVSSIMSLTAGPRIIASTQGPVGLTGDTVNTSKDSSGTTLANTFQITFDKPIDPSSYTAGLTSPMAEAISVYYESPAGGTKILLPLMGQGVTPLNANLATGLGATEFSISFNPASLAGTAYGYVGTYSYVIAPTGIIGQDRTVSAPTLTAGTTESAGVFDYTATVPAGPSATNTNSVTSSVAVTGLTGQFLIANPTGTTNLVNAPYPTGNVAGTFTGTVTLIEPTANPPAVATDYTVTLITPTGQTVTLTGGNATYVVNGNNTTTTTVTFNAVDFTVPVSNAVRADGTYSLRVTGQPTDTITINSGWQLTLNTDIFGYAPLAPNGGSSAINVVPPQEATTSVTVTGLAGQFLNASPSTAGTFTGSITLVEPSTSPATAATDYTVTLVLPNNQTVTLTGGTATFVDNGDGTTTTTVTFNAVGFTIPDANTVPANGTYTLEVTVGNQAPKTITINNGWRLSLNTQNHTGYIAPTGSAASSLTPPPDATTSVTITGHAGQYLIANPTGTGNLVNAAYPTGNVAGTFTGTITLIEPTSNPSAAATDYSVTLLTPNGQIITLTGGTATFVVNANGSTTTTVAFNADEFTVPVSNTVPVNGTYTLQVVAGGETHETIEINSGWELTLNTVLATTTTNLGTVMDQNANGTSGQVTGDDYVVGQPTGFTSYATGTLPLIVPGPHVLSVTPVAPNTGTPVTYSPIISVGSTNNLVLDNNVTYLEVTFDRNILVSSFTASQILSIFGPAGAVSTTGLLTPVPLSVYTAGGQMTYTNGTSADVFLIKIPTQEISGTYTITLGTGIVAADSSATTAAGIDANTNAGLDALRQTATNGVTVPVTYASTMVPATIAPATVNVGGGISNSALLAPIAVPDDFPIQPDDLATGISSITLTLNISYAHDPDLTAQLLYFLPGVDATVAGNAAASLSLFSGVGSGSNTANFSTTTFSDTASTSIDKAAAPFFGTFTPEQPFSNFGPGSGNDDLNSQGTWVLYIQNDGSLSGTLNSWSLTFQKPVSSTGLAEAADDQSHASFQIFNLAASNPLANSTWTAVGPAGVTTSIINGEGTLAGTISSVAVDPSDTTGNTVFVGTAGGGVWKTTDFLTSAVGGPTYVPLTDNGPSFAQNIGSVAVFGRNNDPSQTIVFAGTGFAQEGTITTGGTPNAELNTGTGDGIIRSMDGGQTWEVLNGVTGSVYKIVVDPTPTLSGQAIVYAATTTGLYRSLDSGNDWTLLEAGNATDVILDPNSGSPTTHNLDTLYVAFSNVTSFDTPYYANGPVGIYYSVNQGQTLLPLNGELGKDPLLVTPGFPAQPLGVENSVTPNNANSAYIVLAKPALSGNIAENLAYQGWLYAAVENYNGTFQGLYVTKDDGENWTLVQLGNIPGTGSDKAAVPTNTTTGTDSYDPTSSNFTSQGAYDLTLTIDPTNPNIVYIGGSQNFQASGLIRVDLTDLYDAHNLTSGSNNQTDGGALFVNGQGGVVSANADATYPVGNPNNPTQILNLRYAPNNGTAGTSPFNINATLVIANASEFVNDGTGATWTLFDEPLKANAGDETGSTNLHDVIDYVDPITGEVRLIFADDEGVFSTLVNQDGTMSDGIGTYAEPEYSRNGNLQDEELLDSAAQPSAASATAAGAEFYASGTTTVDAQSDANVLTDGNLTWSDSGVLSPGVGSPRNTAANSSINTSDRSGVGIATDQTGSGTLYEYDVPILGGNLTDFFRVNSYGQTTGLDGNVTQDFPENGSPGDAHQGGVLVTPVTNSPNTLTDAQILQSNFEVNPLNGDQIVIASATGNLYETTNQGILWTPIGTAADFGADAALDNTGRPGHTAPLPVDISTIAYGAPDPNVIGGVGNLNNFIYVGTTGLSYTPNGLGANPSDPYINPADGLLYNDGHIYVTQAGGEGWMDISSGLDGSSIVGIYPDPDRGSHAAYAVTKTGIFYSPDTIGLADAGSTVWTNITSNLESLTFDAFGNAAYQQSVLAGFSYTPVNDTYGTTNNLAPPLPYNPVFSSQYGGFTDIVADYRYQIPAPTNATEGTNIYYPVLYASGYGGVFRSLDNGVTWTVFPNESFDNAPVDGGYLPDVDVTSLSLDLGDINPDTGHPQSTTHSATSTQQVTLNPAGTVTSSLTITDTSGVQITAGTVVVTLTNTSLSGGNNVGNLTLTLTGPGGQTYVLPTSSIVATSLDSATFQLPASFLNESLIGLYTLSITDNTAGDAGVLKGFGVTLVDVNPEILVATTYGRGDFAIRLAPDVIPTSIAFDTSLPAPNGSDSSGVGITNTLEPYFDGVSEVSNYGNTVTVNIYDESPDSPYFGALLGTGFTNALGQFVVQIDPSTAVLNGQTIVDEYFLTSSATYNDKTIGIQATDSTGASGNLTLFHYTLDLINPNTPNAPVLEATYDTGRSTTDGLTNLSVPAQSGPGGTLNIVTPVFDVTTPLPQAYSLTPNPISLTVELLRSTSPNGPFFVIDSTETGFVNGAGTLETYMLNDSGLATLAATGIDETFYYEALQIDEAGNVSTPASNVTAITVDTIAPAAPTSLTLVPPITGTPPSPTFNVAGVLPNDQVLLYRSINGGAPILVGTGAINTTNAAATLPVTDTVGASPDGVYTYYAAQLDVYGNYSLLSAGVMEIINTQTPPAAPILESKYDTGRSSSDDLTNIAVPAPTPGSTPNFVAPVFDVNTVAPATGQPAIATVQLFRATSAAGPYTMVASVPFTGNPAMLTDTSLVALVSAGVNESFYYEADQINAAGIESAKSPALKITVDTITPATLPAPTLDPASNTGLVPTQLITNVTKPFIDYTNLLPGEQVFLYRSIGSSTPILVGTGPINTTGSNLSGKIQDTTGATPDGVYQYYVVQQDIVGNISKFSQAVTVTVNTTSPTKPTIALLTSDDTGLPSHPNVTSVNTPHFTGTAQYNAGTNFPVYIDNVATGAILAKTYPSANGTYLAQITTPLPDGVYTLAALSENLAGNFSISSYLTITIKHTGPKVPPNLMLLPADDTGIKGDGVTSNHDPAFIGTTDPGDIVSLYVLVNGTLLGPEATTTSSTVNGSFTFTLPFNLTDGTTQLVAQTSDIAGNKGAFSNPYTVRITTTAGDYLGTGTAQLALFDPYNETYYIRISATQTVAVPVDVTVGRDIPIQNDFNGDGVTDLSAYRYNTATFYGFISNGAAENQQFGPAGASLPVSGYYGGSGTYIYGAYVPSTGTWYVALPTPGGVVARFGVPGIDIPAQAAYNGGGSTEIAVFRPTVVTGGDADAFFVYGPNGQYEVSFTSPAVQKLGFVYKAGDIAAPADYLGLGYDQFAIYRPSTGQFFILNTPSDTNTATWTLKTVTLNLPGGPKTGDVPASEDYYGTGLVDPTVYRPSNSTFYILNSVTGVQSTVQFQPFASTLSNQFIAAAGPILYRLNALLGTYATTGGYSLPTTGGSGGTGNSITLPGASSVHTNAVTASAATSTTPGTTDSVVSPLTTLMAVATPIAVTSTPTPSAPTTSLALSSTPLIPVTVGVQTPTASSAVVVGPKTTTSTHFTSSKKVTKHTAETSSLEASTKPLTAKSKAHVTSTPAETHAKTTAKVAAAKAETKTRTTLGAMAAASLQHLVMAAKGRKKS